MPASSIIIIGAGTGGGGNRVQMEFNSPYIVAAGDTAENTGTGAVVLSFSGENGDSNIPLAGLSGYEFQEAGTVSVSV